MKKLCLCLLFFAIYFNCFSQNVHIHIPGVGTQILNDGGANYIHANMNIPTRGIMYIGGLGQSNMGDRLSAISASDTTSNPNVQIFNRTTNTFVTAIPGQAPFPTISGGNIGIPHIFYLAKLLQKQTGKIIRIVRYYHDSQPISSFWTGSAIGPDLDSFYVYSAAASVPSYDLFIWDQGENNDATGWSPGNTTGYILSHDSIMANLRRQSWFPPTTPTLVIGMPQTGQGSVTNFHYSDTVLKIIGSGRDRWIQYVPTDSAQVNSGDIHFSNAGKSTIATYELQKYMLLPWPKPNTLIFGNYGLFVHKDSLPYGGAQSWTVSTQNKTESGASGYAMLDSSGTVNMRIITQNGTTSVSGVYTAGENVISSENGKNLGIYRAFTKVLGIGSAGISIFGGTTQTQTSSAIFNDIDFVGQDNAHTWLFGGVGSTYNNSPTLVNSFTIYNLTNGPVFSVSPTGQTLLGINTNAITPSARLTLLGNITAAANGIKGNMISQEVGTINDNTTAANATIPMWAVNGLAADTLNANANGVTASSATTLYIPGSPVSNATNHTTLTKTFPLYVAGALGTSSNASVFRGGLFINDTIYRGSTFQVNGGFWQNKDSLITSTAGSVMAEGIDTISGRHVKFPVVSSSGVTTVGSFSGSSQTNGASIAGSTITFGPADGTNPGMIKASGSQTLGATLTLTNALTLSTLASSGSTDSMVTADASIGTLHRTTLQQVFKNNLIYAPGTNGGSFAVANCSSPSSVHFHSGLLGGGAFVVGYVTVTVTAANTLTQLEVYPGIASITSVTDVIGTLTAWNNTSTGNVSGFCSGVTSDSGILLSFYPTATGSYTVYFQFGQVTH